MKDKKLKRAMKIIESALKIVDASKMAHEKFPSTEAGYIANHYRRNDYEQGIQDTLDLIKKATWPKERLK